MESKELHQARRCFAEFERRIMGIGGANYNDLDASINCLTDALDAAASVIEDSESDEADRNRARNLVCSYYKRMLRSAKDIYKTGDEVDIGYYGHFLMIFPEDDLMVRELTEEERDTTRSIIIAMLEIKTTQLYDIDKLADWLEFLTRIKTQDDRLTALRDTVRKRIEKRKS